MKIKYRKPFEAYQVQSGAKKDMDQLPFQGKAAYRVWSVIRGVQMFEDDGMNGNWVVVNKSDWIVQDEHGELSVWADTEFRIHFEEAAQ